MENIIWLVDATMSLDHASVDKIIQLANNFAKSVDIVIDKRLRSVERWYWKHLTGSGTVEDSLAIHQASLARQLSIRFESRGVKYRVHRTNSSDDVLSTGQLVADNALLI